MSVPYFKLYQSIRDEGETIYNSKKEAIFTVTGM